VDTHPLDIPETDAWRDGDLSILADPRTPDLFHIRFAGVASFEADFGKREIRVCKLGDPSPETLQHLIFDQIYPRILANYGKLVLHAAGILFGTDAVLLLGASGSGKSTLGAAMHQAGLPLLGDDAVVISWDGGLPVARAVYPSLRLFRDSIDRVWDASAELSRVADYTDKWNVLGLDDGSSPKAAPVRAIFILDPHRDDAIELAPADGSAACIALVEQSFSLHPANPADAARRLGQASALAEHVPKFRLRFPRDYSRLPAVREAICSILTE
jgi:hypothetical protein